jgi:hypothetical protein
MIHRKAFASLLFSGLVASCSGNVSGEVDGLGVGAMWSGVMGDEETNIPLLGGDYQQVNATWYSYGDACTHYKNLDGEDADDREQYFKDKLPQEWWSVSFSATDDDSNDLKNFNGDLSDDDLVFITICHNKDYPDADGNVLVFDQDCYGANDGDVELQWVEGESVRLTGTDVELAEGDGDDAGTIGFSGSASFCEDFDDTL